MNNYNRYKKYREKYFILKKSISNLQSGGGDEEVMMNCARKGEDENKIIICSNKPVGDILSVPFDKFLYKCIGDRHANNYMCSNVDKQKLRALSYDNVGERARALDIMSDDVLFFLFVIIFTVSNSKFVGVKHGMYLADFAEADDHSWLPISSGRETFAVNGRLIRLLERTANMKSYQLFKSFYREGNEGNDGYDVLCVNDMNRIPEVIEFIKLHFMKKGLGVYTDLFLENMVTIGKNLVQHGDGDEDEDEFIEVDLSPIYKLNYSEKSVNLQRYFNQSLVRLINFCSSNDHECYQYVVTTHQNQARIKFSPGMWQYFVYYGNENAPQISVLLSRDFTRMQHISGDIATRYVSFMGIHPIKGVGKKLLDELRKFVIEKDIKHKIKVLPVSDNRPWKKLVSQYPDIIVYDSNYE